MTHSLLDDTRTEAVIGTAATLPPELAQYLGEQSPSLSSLGFDLVRTIEGRHSELLEFRPRHVLVKRITRSRNPATARATVTREFAALQTLAGLVDSELKGSIPRPLLVLPDANTLVLECLRGTPLVRVLKRDANRMMGIFRRTRARKTGILVGQWLHRFHHATRQPPLHHDHPVYLAQLAKQLEHCDEIKLGSAADEVLELASRASQRVHGQVVPCAARHGDFIPQNILVDGSNVRVVDFENFRERDVVYGDAGTFVAYLTMLGGRPLYSTAALRAMTAGFLAGYGREVRDTVFDLYILKSQVTNASMFQRRPGLRGVVANLQSFRHRILDSARALPGSHR